MTVLAYTDHVISVYFYMALQEHAKKFNPLYPDFCMRLTNANGIRSLEGPCNPVALI